MNWKSHFEMIPDTSGQERALRRIPHVPLERRLSPEECRQRFDCPRFHKRVYWVLSHYSEQAPSAYNAHGRTTPGYTSSWITLDVEPLRTMLNPKAKKSAKAAARLMMATTVSISIADPRPEASTTGNTDESYFCSSSDVP